ncbi:hypothetical protein BCK_17300 [Bacillus cereus FRI-35]|nr:hypothetical protein BCK_17300 [Bacillus cereus FRI-35]
MQLYVNDVEKSLLFYKKIIALKLSIQMDISSELRIKKGKHEKCLPFFYENIQKNEPFSRLIRLIHVKLNLK